MVYGSLVRLQIQKNYLLKTETKIYTIKNGLVLGSGITQPDQNWFEQFVSQMDNKVSTAQGYANDAQASKTAAAGSATAAAQSADASAKALQENKDYVESQKETFVGYNKRETDLKYANALIGSASGTGRVTVEDAWEAPIPDLEVAGKSDQFTTTGAQLFDASLIPALTAGGVTVEGTADGGYHISGSGDSGTFYKTVKITDLTMLKAGNIMLKSESSVPKFSVRLMDSSSTILFELTADQTRTITEEMLSTEGVYLQYMFYGAVSNVTPGTYYPMLYQDGDGTWEPYTGGQPSPSPDYPQPIISTGTVTTGEQLLDTEAYELGTFGNATGNPNDSEITYRWLQYIPVTEGSTIYFKKPLCICYYDSDKRFVSCDESPDIYQRLVPQTAAFIRCRTFAGDFADFNHRDYMISNNPISAWEPYTGGKPSPSEEYPQPLDVTVTGENLFDASLLKSMAGGAWSSSDGGRRISVTGIKPYAACTAVVPIECVRGKTVTLSGNIESRTNVDCPVAIQGRLTLSDGRLEYYAATYKKTVITIPEDAQSFKIELITNNRNTALDIANTTVFTDVLLSFDAKAIWEPFAGCWAATIQLTAPLHGIGDVRDEITMTKRIDRCVELTFDGSEYWKIVENASMEAFWLSDALPFSAKLRSGLCNQFPVVSSQGEAEAVWIGFNNTILYCVHNRFYNAEADDKGLSAWKAHLASHPLKIVTYLDTPVETDLPAATQTALNALTTFTGTTHITITAGGPEPDVAVEYVQDTNVIIAGLKRLIEGLINA